jgi:hypothetical protein
VVDHEGEQLVLARDVAVQTHRRDAEEGGHAGHRHRGETLGAGHGDGGVDDAVQGQARPRAFAALLAQPPRLGDGVGQLDGGRSRLLARLHVLIIAHPLPGRCFCV